MRNTCFEDGAMAPICYTRVAANGDIVSGHEKWGYCNLQCNGEMLVTNSTFNLAMPDFENIWEENMFDLSNFGTGYCYTYNPPNKTLAEFAHRLFMLLGNKESHGDLLIGFNIYLHEEGQFWPRPDLQAVNGQSSLTVPLHKEIEGQFSIKQDDP